RPVMDTVIVDDEPAARAGMRHMLSEVEWIECIGEAANGPAAIEAIDSLKPELVFMDILMPGLLGTDVLRRVQHQPFVVFTTAFAQHAVTAFELGALDYLLKPFGEDRLRATLDRIRSAMGEPRPSSMDRFSEAMSHAPMSRLFVRTGRSIVPIPVEDIARFEAVGDYIAAHSGGSRHLLHLSLNQLEARLDPLRFVRIHRTHIVNLDHLVAFRRDAGGLLTAELKDGTTLQVSRAKSRDLRALAR
ncbi:MAG TPA: LytTR family DNA-binding domain-containing protein, partial [Xanthomonadaceae bacterium]|nr:LytTR family DNA-binding domain-containing protein [Xanthomonadaceae bacterium]